MSAAVIDHRTLTGAGAHGRGTGATVPLLRAARAETSVGSGADPVPLLGIPRQGQDAAVMTLARGPPPAPGRHELPDPYPAVRAADGQLTGRAERDRGHLLPVRPFGEKHRRAVPVADGGPW